MGKGMRREREKTGGDRGV